MEQYPKHPGFEYICTLNLNFVNTVVVLFILKIKGKNVNLIYQLFTVFPDKFPAEALVPSSSQFLGVIFPLPSHT